MITPYFQDELVKLYRGGALAMVSNRTRLTQVGLDFGEVPA